MITEEAYVAAVFNAVCLLRFLPTSLRGVRSVLILGSVNAVFFSFVLLVQLVFWDLLRKGILHTFILMCLVRLVGIIVWSLSDMVSVYACRCQDLDLCRASSSCTVSSLLLILLCLFVHPFLATLVCAVCTHAGVLLDLASLFLRAVAWAASWLAAALIHT